MTTFQNCCPTSRKDVSCPKVVLHQPEYAGPWEQGGSLLSPNDKRIGDEVVLGGLEYAFEDSAKDVSCPKVVLHQPEYAGPCVQGGSKLAAAVVLGGIEHVPNSDIVDSD